MKDKVILLLAFVFLQSCIPLRIAPTIEDYKLTKGKRFKRSLPKRKMFVFEDPKDANHFYRYINTKFQLNDENVYDDVPFLLNGQQYFLSFYEVEIPTKTLNLGLIVADGLLDSAGVDSMFEDVYSSRKGNWYIAIETYSNSEKDCLEDRTLSRDAVLQYLRILKQEYLMTHNYNETVFKN